MGYERSIAMMNTECTHVTEFVPIVHPYLLLLYLTISVHSKVCQLGLLQGVGVPLNILLLQHFSTVFLHCLHCFSFEIQAAACVLTFIILQQNETVYFEKTN